MYIGTRYYTENCGTAGAVLCCAMQGHNIRVLCIMVGQGFEILFTGYRINIIVHTENINLTKLGIRMDCITHKEVNLLIHTNYMPSGVKSTQKGFSYHEKPANIHAMAIWDRTTKF